MFSSSRRCSYVWMVMLLHCVGFEWDKYTPRLCQDKTWDLLLESKMYRKVTSMVSWLSLHGDSWNGRMVKNGEKDRNVLSFSEFLFLFTIIRMHADHLDSIIC